MMYEDLEFQNIIKDILKIDEFNKLKECTHHGITRYEHSLRVAYYTFIVCRKLKFKYVEATRAALMHDFFTDEVKDMCAIRRYRNHPKFALINAKKYFELSKLQEDIIIKHMFPITLTPPKYIESWIVDLVDDFSSVYDKVFSIRIGFTELIKSFLIFVIGFFRLK